MRPGGFRHFSSTAWNCAGLTCPVNLPPTVPTLPELGMPLFMDSATAPRATPGPLLVSICALWSPLFRGRGLK
jgi:hypothetical protein